MPASLSTRRGREHRSDRRPQLHEILQSDFLAETSPSSVKYDKFYLLASTCANNLTDIDVIKDDIQTLSMLANVVLTVEPHSSSFN